MNIRFLVLIFLSIIIGLIGLTQCKGVKMKLQKKVPFIFSQVFSQDWVGGQPGNSGTTVQIFVSEVGTIQPDSLYFQNRVTQIDIKPTKKGSLWVANFRKVTRKDFNMTDNPKGEYGNPVPEMINFPFELEKNEAVLRYINEGKAYYYKIVGVKEKEPLFYPSAKPRN
jgi:hypothetical protein